MNAIIARPRQLVSVIGPIPTRMLRAGILASLIILGNVFACVFTCHAGGGPENVFLLVNPISQDSLTVANYYVEQRKIPANNVFYLPFKGSKSMVSGAVFRNQILTPVLAEIQKRQLTNQIDYLVYSCDFPWRVNFGPDFPGKKFPRKFAPHGSLTGLTFLNAFVKEKRQEVVSLNTNWYFTEPLRGITISRAFRGQYRWLPGGKRTNAQGLKYILSAMLGVTNGRGNKVPEIINCLKLATEADGTKPKGTVYFMKHGGPRSTPRHDLFEAAAKEMRLAGVEARVMDGKFPENRPGIVGLTCGTPTATFSPVGSRFIPGAFCDNLTSFGALLSNYKPLFDKKTGKRSTYQVTVCDFIRHGATAASGTVFEPFNIKEKFPLPTVHVHYARGCSLGEAFYQSVSGPYQQLLVGDPLCQPWAETPIVKVAEVTQGQSLKGSIEITPSKSEKQNIPIRHFELFLNGKRTSICRPGGKFTLDTTSLEDGHHELRVVAVDDTPIETQGRWIANVTIKNGRDAIGLSTKQKRTSLSNKYVSIEVTSTVDSPIEIFCNHQKLGSVASGSGTLKIATDKLGAGNVTLYAVSQGLRSKPLQLLVKP